jgi:hypothetical protein
MNNDPLWSNIFKNIFNMDVFGAKCPICKENYHDISICPNVERIDYDENGQIKDIFVREKE